jgi:hypothetical protein
VLFADLCRRIVILIKKSKDSSAWPILWLSLLSVILGLALLWPTPGPRGAFTVILLCLALPAAMFARLEYATAAAIVCIPVHNYLTASIGLGEDAPTGINVGIIWTGLMLVIFLARYRSVPLDKMERGLFYIYVLLIGFQSVANYRGTGLGISDWLLILSGSARILCVFLWLRHAARLLPWTRSRWACAGLGIGPIIVGSSMFGGTFREARGWSPEAFGLSRSSGLTDPNYAAVGAVMALLFLCATSELTGKHMKLSLLFLPATFIFSLLSGSRTGFFSALFGSVILLYGKHNKLLLAGVLSLGGVFFVMKGFAPVLYDRFTQLETDSRSGSGLMEVRAEAFSNAWTSFLQHPLIGSGRDTYRFASVSAVGAHNSFLAYLAEGGILYGAAFVLFLWYLLTVTSACNRRWPVAGHAGTAILCAYAVGSNGVYFNCIDYNSTILIGYIAYFLGGLRGSSAAAIAAGLPKPAIRTSPRNRDVPAPERHKQVAY